MPSTIAVNFTTQSEVQGSNPPVNKSVSAKVLRDVLDDGQISGGYVRLAGTETITGAKTFSAGIAATTATINTSLTVGVGPNGYARLNNGNATKPGYLAWHTPDAVRRGYVGWESGDTENISFNLENGWGLVINSPEKPVVIQGDIEVTGNNSGIIPVGAIMPFAMNSNPNGWLFCNGASLGTGAYAALFAQIGYTYGGSGASFNLPDLRGYFVRGAGTNDDGTASGTFGQKQAHAFAQHNHSYQDYYVSTARVLVTGNCGGEMNPGCARNGLMTGVTETGANLSRTTGNTPVLETETRPSNIAMRYCIKWN